MKVTIQSFLDFKKKNISQDQFEVELLKHFLGLDLKNKITSNDIDKKAQELIKLFSKDKHILLPMFKHNGVVYGFIPNISDDLTLGEYVDLNNYSTKDEDTIKWLSVLYRPVVYKKGNLYTIEEYKGNVYPFEDLDVVVLLGAQDFFFRLAKAYLRSTEHSLKEEQMMTMN